MYNLKNRNFLTLLDFNPKEIKFLLDLSRDLKRAKYGGYEHPGLKGKNFALIFEKDSTRTRVAFEVAALDQGAHVTYLDATKTQIGKKETIKDTARVLGRIYDGIEYRGFEQSSVEVLARWAGVPVWNGLTDQHHPTQIIADLMTMREHSSKPLNKISFCYLGRMFNMGRSLAIGAAKMGMDMRLCTPKELGPDPEFMQICQDIAKETGAKITFPTDPREAVKGVDFIHSCTWLAMGDSEEVWDERVALLKPYRIDKEMLKASGNPKVKFMHCLPSLHNADTTVGKEKCAKYKMNGLEVDDEVFESEASIVFDQAENRLHSIKAIMLATVS